MRKDGKSQYQLKKEKLQAIRKRLIEFCQHQTTIENTGKLWDDLWEIVKNEK